VRLLHWVPALTGGLPIVAVHLTYLLSATAGYVPWCIPYLDSCTSISATGRHGVAFWVFKGTMIPAALLLIAYWALIARWLRTLGDDSRGPRTIATLGIIGAVFLVVYTVALGAAGDAMQVQRRTGITLYFALTAFSQLLLVWRLGRLRPPTPVDRVLYTLCAALYVTGLATVVLDGVMSDYDRIEDAAEWVLALLMHVFVIVTALSWRESGFAKKTGPEPGPE